MSEDFLTFYDYLKADLDKYRGSFDEYIFYLPEIFNLLCDLLNADLKKYDRLLVACALGYFVAPKDVIHDELYGPVGYVDDMFLCCHILNKIKDKYGIKLIKKYWHYEKDFEEVFKIAFSESKKFVEEEKLKSKILQYVGLK